MYAWRIMAAGLAATLGLSACTHAAWADDFEQRWAPVPKAHADPGPPPPVDAAPAPPANSSDTDARGASEPPAPRAERAAPPAASSTAEAPHQAQRAKTAFVGKASYYKYRRGKTASGEAFRADGFTAAHRTLPFGTRLRVTDLKTSKHVDVVVTDRGPAARGRVLDLSFGAAKALGIGDRGIIQIRAELING